MNNCIFIILIILFFNSCNGQDKSKSVEEKYTLIRDNLYEDSNGNLYFKTLDKSQNDTKIIRYLDVVYSEKFGDDGVKKMKDVVDKKTFIFDKHKKIYRDKNNQYIYKEMLDGGTISILE